MQHLLKKENQKITLQISPVGFLIIGILHPFFLPNNSVLTFVFLVASLLLNTIKISNLNFSHGYTTQNVLILLLTEKSCSARSLRLNSLDQFKLFMNILVFYLL